MSSLKKTRKITLKKGKKEDKDALPEKTLSGSVISDEDIISESISSENAISEIKSKTTKNSKLKKSNPKSHSSSWIHSLSISDVTKIQFHLNNKESNISIPFVNGIRRVILSNIPCYAIEDSSVLFLENNSIYNNEFLKHRLTLIPIYSDLDIQYDEIEIECVITNTDEYIMNITVNDFKIRNRVTEEVYEPKMIFPYPSCLLAKLKNGQSMHFKCNVSKNTANSKGSSYCPVSTCIYEFKIDEDKVIEKTSMMSEEEKLSFSNQDIQRIIEYTDNGLPSSYIFKIESIGFYSISKIFLMGLNILSDKMRTFMEEFTNLSMSSMIEVMIEPLAMEFMIFKVHQHNDTLGNLLTYYLMKNENIEYAGYLIEHPLHHHILLKIKLKGENSIILLQNIMRETVENILFLLEQIGNDYQKNI